MGTLVTFLLYMSRMKSLSRIIWIILIGISYAGLNAQEPGDQIAGSWLGTLDAGGVELRIVFNLSFLENTGYKATMDSPDQGAKDIPCGEVLQNGDSIRIEVPIAAGYYKGKITSSKTITGTWHQANRDFELNLEKQDSVFVLNRPQEPKPPYPYREVEVSFENRIQHFNLGGTLTIPVGDGPFPAVVLVTGSGSQNRDEEIFGHKPFKLIADQLTRKGIAVLRFDDRGVGSSGGNAIGATTQDLAVDARSAIEFLFGQHGIDTSKVGVIGHSEGGMIAFMLAAEYDDIAFIITLAGPGVDGKEILLDQSDYINRLSGVNESFLKDNRIVMNKVFDLMISNESYDQWKVEILKFTSEFYSSKDYYSKEDIEQARKNLVGSIPESAYAWMRYFVMFDPSDLFGSIKCPVLALNGEKDCQVMAEKNSDAIKNGLFSSGNAKVKTMIIPGLNHLFQHCETGLPNEYGQIEETFDPKTLEIISEWIKQQVD